MALTLQTAFKHSPWGRHLQRSAQPRAAGKSSPLRAGFPGLWCLLLPTLFRREQAGTCGPRRPARGGAWSARGGRPAGSASARARHGVAYLGGKSAGARGAGAGAGGGRARWRLGRRSSGHRGAGANPAQAGAGGCHTCITAPTPPPPAPAQRAARPRHSERRGRAPPGSSVRPDPILTLFPPGLGIRWVPCGQPLASTSLLIPGGVSRKTGWEGDPGREGDPRGPDLLTDRRQTSYSSSSEFGPLRVPGVPSLRSLRPARSEGALCAPYPLSPTPN